jgi:hypothetical protein
VSQNADPRAPDPYLHLPRARQPQESALEFLKKFAMLRQVFGAFLLILIGVELMRTVVTYLEKHELHVEVVFTVAMIAIARHAIDVDIEHIDPLALLGMGALIVALIPARDRRDGGLKAQARASASLTSRSLIGISIASTGKIGIAAGRAMLSAARIPTATGRRRVTAS